MRKYFTLQKPRLDIGDLEDELSKNLRSLENKNNLLLRLMYEQTKARTKEKIFSLTCDYGLQVFNVENCGIYLPDSENKKLVAVALKSQKAIEEKINKIHLVNEFPLNSDYPLVRAFRNNRLIFATRDVPSSIKKAGIKSCIYFPITLKEKVLGIFALCSLKSFALNDDDIRIGELLAMHLGLKIYNQDLVDAFKLQNETLQMLQNSVKEGFSLHGSDGVIYYANKAIGQFFGTTKSPIGVKREELIKNWDKYHRYKVSRLYDLNEMKKKVYDEKKPFLNNLIVVHSTPPKIIEANYYPVVKNGNFAGMAASYRDVTKEKKQEMELEQQFKNIQSEKDRWEAVFGNVDEGICFLDTKFNITHMNTACEVYSGSSIREVVGQNYFKVFKCHTPKGLYYPDFNPLEKLLITKESIPYEEYLYTNTHGEEVWVGVSASPIKDSNGQVQEIVLVIRDINSLKEVEKAKSQFVSIASHELRTPLTVINGYLSLLINGDFGDFSNEDSRKRLKIVLNKVYGETTRLTNLVSDLLNVSRIEEKRILLNRKQASIKEVIQEVVEKLSYIAQEKDISLRVDNQLGDRELKAYFDKSKIHEVIMNLVDNAIKFTNNGGEVVINSWEQDGKVFVSVQDNGIGIPKNLQPVIFEKFQQAPGSYLKENKGTGLGLFIVKSLVEMHEGELKLESEPGRGSKFTFSLPTAVA